jgi:60 kDa SS-A/Ro ribonucleoprotein
MFLDSDPGPSRTSYLLGPHDGARVETFEAVQALKHQVPGEAARAIVRHRLTREMVPTELLRHAVAWEALLEWMPLAAMVRNLGVMSKVGLLVPTSAASRSVVGRLGDRAALRAARLHPVGLLAALRTYARGRGVKGVGKWTPLPQVVDALDAAFYLAFDSAPSTGKRVLLALDVSGSMSAPVLGRPVHDLHRQ